MAGRLGRFVWQGLTGLAVVVLVLVGVSFLIGILKAALSVGALLLLGFVIWKIVA
ncbi:MAG: hypothetical protein JXB32_03235 [Deltaproteobacteria bacterium]|nr:hypothetical protein [Deltaproteobacteria bacterium]